MSTPKTLAEDVLTPARLRELWTANYLPALPITPQQFDIGTLLPAMLYMARWGQRRGRGTFKETFGKRENERAQSPTVMDVVNGLVGKKAEALRGFDDDLPKALLGDLLLTYSLENRKNEEGRDQQVQRMFATHYYASWVDLPESVAHLRGVPELLTALLAWSTHGEAITAGGKGLFPVGDAFSINPLLKLFARYMRVEGNASSQTSDRFDETQASDLGIDEWLAVRAAQACVRVPDRAGRGRGDGDSRIPNRWPIAKQAARSLRQDLMTFIQVYGPLMPRQAFQPMLESGIALGLTNILLSTAAALFEWDRTGELPKDGIPMPLFVDCSIGQNIELRKVSEAVMSACAARYERLPALMTCLRVLDERARFDRKLRDEVPSPFPDATARINLLGALLHENHPRAEHLMNELDSDCLRLAEKLDEDGDAPGVVELLRDSNQNPARRISESLVELMGDAQQGRHFRSALECALMSDRPNGIAVKRRVLRVESGRKKSHDVRAIVLTNPALDFLVHRHLRKEGKGRPAQPLSLHQFLARLRLNYGLYVDREPPGVSIPQDLLRENKRWLERRLRDLGLLVGVNDAESMKQLRPRFEAETQIAEEAVDGR